MPRASFSSCEASSWFSDTSLTCQYASGAGRTKSWQVTVGENAGSCSTALSYGAALEFVQTLPNPYFKSVVETCDGICSCDNAGVPSCSGAGDCTCIPPFSPVNVNGNCNGTCTCDSAGNATCSGIGSCLCHYFGSRRNLLGTVRTSVFILGSGLGSNAEYSSAIRFGGAGGAGMGGSSSGYSLWQSTTSIRTLSATGQGGTETIIMTAGHTIASHSGGLSYDSQVISHFRGPPHTPVTATCNGVCVCDSAGEASCTQFVASVAVGTGADAGTGYDTGSQPATITCVQPCTGTGFQGTCTVGTDGVVQSITVTSGGSGYSATNLPTISCPGGNDDLITTPTLGGGNGGTCSCVRVMQNRAIESSSSTLIGGQWLGTAHHSVQARFASTACSYSNWYGQSSILCKVAP